MIGPSFPMKIICENGEFFPHETMISIVPMKRDFTKLFSMKQEINDCLTCHEP